MRQLLGGGLGAQPGPNGRGLILDQGFAHRLVAGAEWVKERLRDGDLAQNHVNWQWLAGSCTNPAPYLRIFNPITRSERFDPDGTYIHRYLPELTDLPLEHLHQPGKNPADLPAGYPRPIVDHPMERN